MKLDVSYTDHSHIIGKGGLTIKRVMEETGCHIHFPDSNRSNHQDKSNQVSIAGEMEGVERARARVRVRASFRAESAPERLTYTVVVSEPDAPDLLVRAAHYGRVAKHSGLHLAVRGEDTGEVQRASHVSHETEAARHSGGRERLRMGGFPGQGGDGAADSLHVQKFSCE